MPLTLIFILSLLKMGMTGNWTKSDCLRKTFGSNSFVCVCSTEYCDYLGDSSVYFFKGHVYIYVSDMYHYRLKFFLRDIVNLKSGGHPDVIVNIRPDKRNQELLGFGGSFSDATGINIYNLPEGLGERIIYEYYCKDGGINYSFGRVPIGSTDFSTELYSYDSIWDDFELKYFSLSREDYHYKIPLIKKAIKCSPELKLFGSMWDPPAWFLADERMDFGSYLKEPVGGSYYQLLADYYVKFLDAYKDKGVSFWGLTTSNEPEIGARFPVLTAFDPDMLRDYLKYNLGPTLKVHGYGKEFLKLLIFDDNLVKFTEYIEPIMEDLEAAKYVSGIAFHWYAKDAGYSQLDEVRSKYPKAFLLSTEACNNTVVNGLAVLGDWTSAEDYAHDIIQTLNRNSVGWIDWNLALNLIGGPSWKANYVNAAIIVDAELKTYYRQPTFYALAHFSKFIDPGSVRITVETVKEDSDVELTAFIGDQGQIILVILNTSSKSKKMEIRNFCISTIQLELLPRSIQTVICVKW